MTGAQHAAAPVSRGTEAAAVSVRRARGRQFTLTALQAAATALYSVLPAP